MIFHGDEEGEELELEERARRPDAEPDVSRETSNRGRETSAAPIREERPVPTPSRSSSRSRSSRSSGPAVDGPGDADCSYVAVFGMKGMGKTTLARAVYKARIRAGGSGVWVAGAGGNDDLGTVARSSGEAARIIHRALEADRPFSVVVQPGWEPELEELWRVVYETGNVLLALDDCQDFANASYIDRDLSKLVSWGRNAEVDLITTVRTPPELHKQIRGNLDVAITFRQRSRSYAEDLNREFFDLPDGPDRILSLPRFHYLREESGEVTGGRIA